MREIILDTETTGLNPVDGHRVVEIGALELVNKFPTGRTYHVYLDPEREMPAEAEAVHGLSGAFLKGKPLFKNIAGEFLEFIEGAVLIIHNAAFDTGFLNAELNAAGHAKIQPEQVIDTLMLARQRHPMGPNSLNALCKRYGIDNSRRTKHGALLDAELLAAVYIELSGGKQAALGLAAAPKPATMAAVPSQRGTTRPAPLADRLSTGEREAHELHVAQLGPGALWLKSGVS